MTRPHMLLCALLVLSSWLMAACMQSPLRITPTALLTPTVGVSLPTTSSTGRTIATRTEVALTRPAPEVIQQALTLAPSTAQRVMFTDWMLVKAQTGQRDLDTSRPVRERLDFSMSMGNGWETLSLCGAARVKMPQANWGWDFTDLLWDARIDLQSSGSTCVFGFPTTFDFPAIAAFYMDRQFSQTNYYGTTIYTSTQEAVLANSSDLDANLLTPDLLNAAVISDAHILILSQDSRNLYAVLDAYRNPTTALLHKPYVAALLTNLGRLTSGGIIPGDTACTEYRTDALLDTPRNSTLRKNLLKQIGPELQQVQGYEMLGIGYRYDNGKPLVQLALTYASSTVAESEAQVRGNIVRKGISLSTQRSYADSLFTLLSTSVQDTTVVLGLQGVPPGRVRLNNLLAKRDMLVAACPKP